MTRPPSGQAAKFAVIGAIGFVVDGGVLSLLNGLFELDLIRSRLISFLIAVTVTWLLNRYHTFSERRDRRATREWGRYLARNGTGALLNMGIFFWLIYRFEWMTAWPIAALAVAAPIALVFNFLGSKHIAFQQRFH